MIDTSALIRLKPKETEMAYRVVYGETIPVWERSFPTLREAKAFAKEHESFGDVIFGITKIIPGESPRSLMAMLVR